MLPTKGTMPEITAAISKQSFIRLRRKVDFNELRARHACLIDLLANRPRRTIGPPGGANCPAAGTSCELGTRIQLAGREKSKELCCATAISSYLYSFVVLVPRSAVQKCQQQLDLIGVADWQLSAGNTCIVNCELFSHIHLRPWLS
ncbi:Vacuolar protein sorting/targeting protein [Trichinella pseudospiralis]